MEEFIDRFKAVRRRTLRETPPEARRLMQELFYIPLASREKVAKIMDEKISGPHGSIPVRLYIPRGTPPFPIIVFFHWGGWVFGSVEESDPLCRKLCNRTEAIVASVDYRLAPEHPYPAPFDDCYAATAWAARHGGEFLGDTSRLCVAGESAGGNLAAAVALRAQADPGVKLSLQVLIYPILKYEIDEAHYKNCPDQNFVTIDSMRWFWKQYLPNGKKGADPFIAPLEAEIMGSLPKTIILTAGHDPLRVEALAYAKLLREHKKTVVTLDYPGVIHGFLELPAGLAASDQALAELAKDIKILL